jgi:hypothetical protein
MEEELDLSQDFFEIIEENQMQNTLTDSTKFY